MKQSLNAKDLILIGVLTAVEWIICMIISTAMSIAGPVTNVFYPAVAAVPCGIVMMLLLAKVPKRGAFAICGTIQGLLFLLVGGFWLIPVALIIGGVICDALMLAGGRATAKSMTIAYTVFNGIFAFGAIVGPMRFLQAAFVAAMEKNNIAQAYIDGMIQMTSGVMPFVIVLAGLLGGWLGAVIGQRALRKHFIKAGLVSLK
ncbi:MAG: MptD family putative ECF transporter S component [Peptococcaceae bacterium]|nr:MptD family putative ECF transporter S component [Peptococcaceae bacterium]